MVQQLLCLFHLYCDHTVQKGVLGDNNACGLVFMCGVLQNLHAPFYETRATCHVTGYFRKRTSKYPGLFSLCCYDAIIAAYYHPASIDFNQRETLEVQIIPVLKNAFLTEILAVCY